MPLLTSGKCEERVLAGPGLRLRHRALALPHFRRPGVRQDHDAHLPVAVRAAAQAPLELPHRRFAGVIELVL